MTDLKTILDYEIRASWWAKLVGVGFLQGLAGRYFARKARRKYRRWMESKAFQNLVRK